MRLLPALGSEGTPAQDARQHGTFLLYVGLFLARPGQKKTYKGEEIRGLRKSRL